MAAGSGVSAITVITLFSSTVPKSGCSAKGFCARKELVFLTQTHNKMGSAFYSFGIIIIIIIQTPQRGRMNTVAKRIQEKDTDEQDFTITEKKLCETIRKRKNWSAPGIDGIPNFWWKKMNGAWSSLIQCFKQWVDQPEEILEWMTQGRTVLLPKSEDLSNERNYRQITCLNTRYKIFTGMNGYYRKEHAERNDIRDISQLGTCSRVLGTVDQLIIDNAIMDEVRTQQRNLSVAFYDYQKAYDMVRHEWMTRVYHWMGVPERVVNVIIKLMEGWNTKLEITEMEKH